MGTNDYILGIDIGGTNTVYGIVDDNGNIVNRGKFSTRNYSGFEKLAADLSGVIREMPFFSKLKAVGVGAPNGNFFTGSIDFAPNLNWGEHILVKDILEHFLSLPVVITNDANAAACGEKFYGGAMEMTDFVTITLGTGVGSGIYVNGNLLQGKHGFGGEFGHIIVEENGRPCGCGKRGCLETYSSVTGIINTVKELISKKENTILINDAALNGKIIEQAAISGDAVALEAFHITSEYLGKALANYVTIFDPEAIFLLGGLAQSGNLIFDNTKKVMEENLMKIFKNKVQILPSQLPDADAAILGAAAIAGEALNS
ncbi:MAG: ROK family protein [Bacteroidales bacterium]|nr:ROK family protein [Bacteroidales bacterium]